MDIALTISTMQVNLHFTQGKCLSITFPACIYGGEILSWADNRMEIEIRKRDGCQGLLKTMGGLECHAEFPDKQIRKLELKEIREKPSSLVVSCDMVK